MRAQIKTSSPSFVTHEKIEKNNEVFQVDTYNYCGNIID